MITSTLLHAPAIACPDLTLDAPHYGAGTTMPYVYTSCDPIYESALEWRFACQGSGNYTYVAANSGFGYLNYAVSAFGGGPLCQPTACSAFLVVHDLEITGPAPTTSLQIVLDLLADTDNPAAITQHTGEIRITLALPDGSFLPEWRTTVPLTTQPIESFQVITPSLTNLPTGQNLRLLVETAWTTPEIGPVDVIGGCTLTFAEYVAATEPGFVANSWEGRIWDNHFLGPIPETCPLDFNGDELFDNGDIFTFINLFLAKDHSADYNGDRIIDNGDLIAFVTRITGGPCP